MTLINRWVDIIHKVATGNWKVKAVLAPVVGIFYLLLVALFIFLSLVTDRLLGFPGAFQSPMSLVVGFCVLETGLFMMAYSIAYFIRVHGTPVPFCPPPELVAEGPYSFSRNPMLTGIFLQLFGLGIVSGSISLVLIFTPLFIAINVWELKMIEEPELERRFGNAYNEYRMQVPMFFPHLRKGRKSCP